MGFLGGFAGGAVVTSVAIYCTLHYHHATRQYQRMLLREQIDAINGLALPSRGFNSQDQSVLLKQEAYAAVMTRRGYAPRSREEPPNLADIAKEKWNEDVKRFANWLHHVRLEDLRWKVEDGIYHAIRRLRGGQ
ncbi:hypothetical protein KEM56_007030 [Ascosphaera pollenicola]|nr:hypothetical protein KEM56_007030 [Ascosphaera pollenicola]